jgi:N-dimethylarginine dimethylaminohydrolase
MIYTEFDTLQEVIVGDCYAPGDVDSFLPKESISSFNKILEETKQDLNNLTDFLKKSNIKVHRPEVQKFEQSIQMPNFKINLPICPIVPRDQYLIMGRDIIQTYTSYTDRYFDSLSYRKIFNELFKEGYNWIAQPLPMLIDSKIDDNWYISDSIYKEKLADQLLWHTASVFKAGDSLIYNGRGPGSQLGLEWLKRNLKEFNYIENTGDTIFKNYGHIDHGFLLIDDDTVIHAGIDWVPLCLRNKKLIDVKNFVGTVITDNYINDYTATDGKYSNAWLEKYLANWRGYTQEICFDLNVLILDSKNILFGKHLPELFEFLKTHNINCHVVTQRHEVYWEGGTHCCTLDVKRKGSKRKII